MEGLLAGGGILSIILLVAAVLAFLIPFFILKIRNQVVSINEKMDKIIKLLSPPPASQTIETTATSVDEPLLKGSATEDDLIKLIHRYWQMRDYKKCKFYCERLIREYPQSDYADFARGRKKELKNF